jgi:hypothetical protein
MIREDPSQASMNRLIKKMAQKKKGGQEPSPLRVYERESTSIK